MDENASSLRDRTAVNAAGADGGGSNASSNALRLSWSFGFNKEIVNGVHNLSTDAAASSTSDQPSRRAIVYTAAHTGVIYDYAQRQQTLLQGHCHPISCCVVSEDKRWIVTADRGEESLIVVWDSLSGNPIKTIFQPHAHGVQALDISPDALFLVTLSAVPGTAPGAAGRKSSTSTGAATGSAKTRVQQELSVWEWTAPAANSMGALYSSFVATEDVQHAVRFNTYDIREIVTNGRQRVIFWNWQQQRLLFYSPSLSQKDFRQVVGNFTQSIFVPDSKQALTGTEDGDLVLWDVVVQPGENDGDDDEAPDPSASGANAMDRKAVKIVRLAGGSELQKKVALTHLTDMDGYLVLGSSDGAVRFYDFDFRLVAWFEDMNAGPVLSVSFASGGGGAGQSQQRPTSASDGESSFQVPEFVVATSSAFIVGMNASLFGEHEPEKRRGTLLMQGINDAIHGLAAHPLFAQVAISSYSGVVQLWDFVSKRLLMMRKFDATDKFRPQCLTFSPDGRRLFVGFTSGVIKILHAQRLEDLAMFRPSKAAITDIRVSPDSNVFVAVDANFYMAMWRLKCAAVDLDSVDEWIYIGRCRAHSKPITGLEFAQAGDGGALLVSVAEDKTMAEYCLGRSSVVDGIVLTQAPVKIEQSATPTACCWHPEMTGLQEDLVLVANDEYKIKQWNASNKTCRKTTLGPSYGGPMNRLLPIPLKPSVLAAAASSASAHAAAVAERYCAYSTHEKVVGLLKLPLDGNPHKCMGLIAHPGAISDVAVSFDGSALLTAGGEDMVVNLWEIHTHQLDLAEASTASEPPSEDQQTVMTATTARKDDGLTPFLTLLEGGREGEFFNEIVDYFYLAQLRVQGENATASREITHRIPLAEIPNVMRALGFYPSDQEIQHMCSEVKYSQFTQTTHAVESIDLPDFIKLYLNHRPVFGMGKQQIEQAFAVLGASPSIAWPMLERRLLHSGEPLSADELRSCLNALIVAPGGNEEVLMDAQYTALSFADKVLGFDDYDEDSSEQQPEVV